MCALGNLWTQTWRRRRALHSVFLPLNCFLFNRFREFISFGFELEILPFLQLNSNFNTCPDGNGCKIGEWIGLSAEIIVFILYWPSQTRTHAHLASFARVLISFAHILFQFFECNLNPLPTTKMKKKKYAEIQLVFQSLYSVCDVSYSICCQNHAPCQPKWFTTPSTASRHTRYYDTQTHTHTQLRQTHT